MFAIQFVALGVVAMVAGVGSLAFRHLLANIRESLLEALSRFGVPVDRAIKRTLGHIRMKAIIKSFYSSDLDVESYRPRDPLDEGQWIRLLIGPEDGPGEESFDVLVCTTRWLARDIHRDHVQMLRHTLVMEVFDLELAMRRLRREVGLATGATWQQLLLSLVQIGRWEFDNYRY